MTDKSLKLTNFSKRSYLETISRQREWEGGRGLPHPSAVGTSNPQTSLPARSAVRLILVQEGCWGGSWCPGL